MRPKKLIWQLYLSYVLIMGLPIVIVTWYASHSFNKFYVTQTMEDLTSRAWLIGSQVGEHISRSSSNTIDSLCKSLSKKVTTRFTVISPTGKVLGDSEKNPDSMENHANRAEVIAAISGKVGVSDRYSYTLLEDMMYTAVPVYVSGKIAAVVRTALPQTSIKAAISRLRARVIWVLIATALLAALVSFLVSRKISLPIKAMKHGAQRFASGDFSVKLSPSGYEETDQLSAALNEMADNLSGLIAQITRQRNQLNAIMSSMIEAVVAIDANERIITVNRAAAALFGIDQRIAEGKWFGEALRNIEIHDFFIKALTTDKPVEGEITLLSPSAGPSDDSARFLQLQGSPLRDSSLTSIGALVVVNDITRLKKLENVRKDFVANVSHELRTPLTSIKGFVETLQAGAMNNPEQARRFLGILANQVDRLNTIVEDLLSLSRIEQDTEKNALDLSEGRLDAVLQAAIEACASKALLKNITIKSACDPEITVRMERTLLEQALVNLIDNAINYSDSGKRIWVNAAQTKDPGGGREEAVISVKDEGMGIARHHLDRLFERFYRVDKARSRKLGGTGLGLSIVKHIALAHGGRVDVESELGNGSTFFIYLPMMQT
jgi:two-component system, OmpR family, phosphate regulon sensor histidine kinase PhoR